MRTKSIKKLLVNMFSKVLFTYVISMLLPIPSHAFELHGIQREEMVIRKYRIIQPLIGIPYKFGGTSLNGLDCSAFTMVVFDNLGIPLPRTAREQAMYGKLELHRLRPGDLIFFHTYAPYPSHVGIYLGDGYMAEASSKYGKVVVVPVLSQEFLVKRFLFAKRLF